ncbi:glycosyltransferase family 9 protein [Nocardioides sp. Kera G14]|uniref:glycosyltransferase family 9 protein n=1 Tax=Nocardioides sp. Kera G14 TaxID=2884264 RepID=UPI001D1220B8|nr:glycosyltransferase family 9 protein [Nocardioides sp. Kera G14]UDY24942.1 glycosyltransferase family 9 protein [Nocardioides sp. Kera G14]
MTTRRVAVRLDSMGDLLLTSRALHALRATCDHLALVCSPSARAAAELLPSVDEVITWEAPWIAPTPPITRAYPQIAFPEVGSLPAELRLRHFDEAVIFTSLHQSSLPTTLVLSQADIPWVGGISSDDAAGLLDLCLTHDTDLHEVQDSLRLALACGGELTDDLPELTLPPRRPELLPPGNFVVLHPGVDSDAQGWPVARFRQLREELSEAGHQVVVTGGPDEARSTARIADGSARDLGGHTDVADLARVMAEADVVLAGDTAAGHLAAAVGTPVVSLVAPTVPPRRWTPYGVPSALLGDPRLTGVTTDDVLGAVDHLTHTRLNAGALSEVR